VTAPDPLLAALRRFFGYDRFRPLQREAIESVLAGRDTVVIAPTGGGKSLCYQLPALLLDGITVVVSPLIALMKDQVDGLTESGVPATFLNSSIPAGESSRRLKSLFAGKTKLLYLAPERLLMDGFLEIIQKLPVRLLAIDEAHCISEWGHDFRREYRQLRRVRSLLPGVPCIALTATATDKVQQDIVKQLGMGEHTLVKGSFVRRNLFYEVRTKQEAYRQLADYLRERAGESGIIYCGSRKVTDSLAERLVADGFDALAYHAGLTPKQRSERQEKFIRDDTGIIVATIAFGMGIDKPNIRFVVHYDLPRTIEGYYQETGRAGRDGLESECVLFYSYGDRLKIDHFIEDKPEHLREAARRQLMQVIGFAESTVCRHRQIAEYFGEVFPEGPCGMCDNCTKPVELVDATTMAQMLLSAVRRTGERFGPAYVVDVLLGNETDRVLHNRHADLSVFGIGRDYPKTAWMGLARQLVTMGYMVQGEYSVLKLTAQCRRVLFEGERVMVKPQAPSARERQKTDRARRAARVAAAGPASEGLFQALRRLRKQIADDMDVPPYVIFNDATLREMAASAPRTLEAMREVSGVGERKLAQYGERFLAAIAEYRG